MKKLVIFGLLMSILMINSSAYAATKHTGAKKTHTITTTCGHNGKVTPKSIGAGALSLLIWPGIGQLMNDGVNTEKAAVHAILGFTGIFRIWSCYDGVVDRTGGVWEDRI